MTDSASPLDDAAVNPEVARAAADWFSRISSDEFGDSDRQAWMAWRASDPAHDRAWARVEAVSQRFGLLLPQAGMAALDQPRAQGRRSALRSIAVLGVVGGAGWLAWEQVAPNGSQRLRTATGERRRFTLSDGTELTLATSTSVDVQFGAQERRIELRQGEILVAASQDALHRPFVVVTRFGEFRPIGTRFTVRQEDSSVRMAVLEGRVQAHRVPVGEANPSPVLVQAGQGVRVDRDGVSNVHATEPGAEAWTQGLLVADGMRLADFAAELSRYRPGVLVCDPAVGGLRLSGAFPLDDTDRALAAVTRALPVRITRLTRYWVRIVPA